MDGLQASWRADRGPRKATAITLLPHRACGALNDKNQLVTSTSALRRASGAFLDSGSDPRVAEAVRAAPPQARYTRPEPLFIPRFGICIAHTPLPPHDLPALKAWPDNGDVVR